MHCSGDRLVNFCGLGNLPNKLTIFLILFTAIRGVEDERGDRGQQTICIADEDTKTVKVIIVLVLAYSSLLSKCSFVLITDHNIGLYIANL